MTTHPDRDYDRAVGAVLRELRHRYRLKQSHLAERLGVDVATISRYERGERAMSVGTLLVIADLFGIPAGSLLPPAHQSTPPAAPAPTPEAPDPMRGLLTHLPQVEAGAIQSIVQVLATQPDLIVPVITAIEQAAERTEQP